MTEKCSACFFELLFFVNKCLEKICRHCCSNPQNCFCFLVHKKLNIKKNEDSKSNQVNINNLVYEIYLFLHNKMTLG